MEINAKTLAFFWKRVKKGDTEDDCWQWLGGKTGSGYGGMSVQLQGKIYCQSAHIFSFRIHNPDIPLKANTLHSCDDKGCTNPKHLSQGTVADNAQDRQYKGRGQNARGTNSSLAKLTEEQVIDIFRRKKESCSMLGVEFNVSASTIHDIWMFRRYSNITFKLLGTGQEKLL